MLLSNNYINDGKSCIVLNDSQKMIRSQIIRKIENGCYNLIHYKCDCNADFNELELLAEKDRYGIPVQTRICKKCGMIISDPSMDQKSLDAFYDNEYRLLYSADSDNLDSFFEEQIRHGEEIVAYLNDKIEMNSKTCVLEVGTGAGGILYSINSITGAKVTGIDLGKKYIDFGKKKGINLLNENTERHVKLHAHQYDLIILSHVLEHFLDLKTELSRIKNLLSDNGMVYVEVPGVKNTNKTYKSFLISLQNAHIRYFSLDTLTQVLRMNGFVCVDGDEYVHALFMKNNTIEKDYHMRNYYDENKNYLTELENKTYLYTKIRLIIAESKVGDFLYRIRKYLRKNGKR